MTKNDWLMLLVTFLGWADGMWMGWVLWRKPNLKYTGEKK